MVTELPLFVENAQSLRAMGAALAAIAVGIFWGDSVVRRHSKDDQISFNKDAKETTDRSESASNPFGSSLTRERWTLAWTAVGVFLFFGIYAQTNFAQTVLSYLGTILAALIPIGLWALSFRELIRIKEEP